MRKLLIAITLALNGIVLAVPPTQPTVEVVTTAPSGACTSNTIKLVRGTDEHYSCTGGQWTLGKTKITDLAATNSPTAGLLLSVDTSDPTKIQYVLGGSGGGGGTSIIKECSGAPPCAATSATTSTATTLAFGPGFDVLASTTTSSNDTANVTLDLVEQPVDLATGQVTGTLQLAHGGVGATTGSGARANIGAAESGANFSITSLNGLLTPLSVPQGGTGLSAVADNQVPLATSTNTYTGVTIPSCPDSGGNHLNYSSHSITCGNSSSGGGGSGYATIQEEGAPVTVRTTENFIGAAITAADDAGNTRTNITLLESPNSASVVGTGRTITPGTGLTGSAPLDLTSDRTLSVDSTEAGFLASGSLTCGASTAGKAEVNSSTPLQYCDNAATPTLRYTAYGDSSGNALSGDSATAFFGVGTLEVARGGTGAGTLGSDGNVLYNSGGAVGNSNSFNFNAGTNTLSVGAISTLDPGNGFRRLDLFGNTIDVGSPAAGVITWYGKGSAGLEVPYIRTNGGGVQQLSVVTSAETLQQKTLTAPVISSSTVATLPSAGTSSGKIWVVTDSTSATSCATGGGSSIVLCRSNGTSWLPLGDGSSSSSSAAGSDTQIQFNDGGTTLGGATTLLWTKGSNKLTVSDGALIDMSGINDSATTEGFRLPQTAGAGSGTAQGQINWDTTNKQVDIGDGSAVNKIATGLVRSIYFKASGLSTDGTNCSTPSEATLNSGPKLYTIACAYNAAGVIYGDIDMPDGWDGSTLTFEPELYNKNAAPANILAFDISAECRRDGNGTTDVIDGTWGTAQTATFTQSNYATKELQQVTTAAVTPNGTCAGGAHLFWRAVVNTGTSTATQSTNSVASTDIFLLGVKVEYTQVSGD